MSPAPAPVFAVAGDELELSFANDARVRVPSGWAWATDALGHLVARSPEEDLHIAWLEVSVDPALDAEGLERVVQDAWRSQDPSFERAVLQHAALPPEGWDTVVQLVYATEPSERRVVVAIARRKGPRLLLALVNGTVDAFGRRAAQVLGFVGSLRMSGVEEEDWSARTPRPLDGAALAHLRTRIEALLAAEHVPGAAVAIVRSNETLLAQGFGVRDLGSSAPVTPRTLFMIGSTTKALSSLLAAVLVDRGRLRWDQPVSELLPEFRLADVEHTAGVQLRHTFCACTGLPRRDLEFVFEPRARRPEQWLALLGTMAPSTAPGEVFQYSNLMVTAGGYATARALDPNAPLDAAFARALDREVLRPLGMRSTTLSMDHARRLQHALPHARRIDGELVAIDPVTETGIASVGPAGAAWSNVLDMARYVQLELRRGRLASGRILVSEENLLARRTPSVAISDDLHYGLGLIVGRAHRLERVGHGGNTMGFTSELVFYPSLDLGLVILSNAGDNNRFTDAVQQALLETVLGLPEEAETRQRERAARAEQMIARVTSELRTPTPDEIASIAGEYESAELGGMVVRAEGEQVMIDTGEWRSRLGLRVSPGGEQTWMPLDAPFTELGFRAAEDGALRLDFPQHPYLFRRVTR